MIDRQVSCDSTIQSINISIKSFPKKELNQNEELGLDIFSLQSTQSVSKEHRVVPPIGTQASFLRKASCMLGVVQPP